MIVYTEILLCIKTKKAQSTAYYRAIEPYSRAVKNPLKLNFIPIETHRFSPLFRGLPETCGKIRHSSTPVQQLSIFLTKKSAKRVLRSLECLEQEAKEHIEGKEH